MVEVIESLNQAENNCIEIEWKREANQKSNEFVFFLHFGNGAAEI